MDGRTGLSEVLLAKGSCGVCGKNRKGNVGGYCLEQSRLGYSRYEILGKREFK